MKNKKAQGFNAAVLVAIIAGLIIIYMMFLPVEDRREMLKETKKGTATSDDNIVLLEEGVGRLDPSERISDRDIPNVYLFESTNSKELATINPIYVRNGVLDKKTKTASFAVDDLDKTENVVLTFTAPKRKGILTIELNDNIIYEYDLNKLNVDPIKISSNLLNNDNVLEFSVSGVGFKFWTTNEYSLENIKVIGDLTDKSRQESRNVFSLTGTEHQNLESAELRFIPYCNLAGNIGILDVQINNQNIYSAVPVCDDPIKQNIPLGILSAGSNRVLFKTSSGSYSVEQIKVNLESKDAITNVYYFEINDTTYDDIVDDNKVVNLVVEFVDDEERKRADLDINGHSIGIDQYDELYEKNVRNWIEENNNFVKITPKTTLDVVELRVEVEE